MAGGFFLLQRVDLVHAGRPISGLEYRVAPFKKGAWKNYAMEQGLPADEVLTIFCDPDGAVWFGTTAGASKFDGKEFVTLAPAQDHKRIFDNDLGRNTGGMGAYAPAPVVTPAVTAIGVPLVTVQFEPGQGMLSYSSSMYPSELEVRA